MYNEEREIKEERYSIEEVVVPYSNINITHVNDNKPPLKMVLKQAMLWFLIALMVLGLFFF